MEGMVGTNERNLLVDVMAQTHSGSATQVMNTCRVVLYEIKKCGIPAGDADGAVDIWVWQCRHSK